MMARICEWVCYKFMGKKRCPSFERLVNVLKDLLILMSLSKGGWHETAWKFMIKSLDMVDAHEPGSKKLLLWQMRRYGGRNPVVEYRRIMNEIRRKKRDFNQP